MIVIKLMFVFLVAMIAILPVIFVMCAVLFLGTKALIKLMMYSKEVGIDEPK